MFEKTRKDLLVALKSSEKLITADNHDPKTIKIASIVPKSIGVYLWRSKTNNEIVYVGRALGKGGLYQRIIRQHLYDRYTKSVFRKQIAEEYGLNMTAESVAFLKDNFTFSFIIFDRNDEKIVSLIETILINEYLPKYNRSGKYNID